MGIKLEGFDELQKKLNQLQKSAKELENTKFIPFDELFTKPFMKKYSNFLTFDELLEAGNFTVSSQEDFESIPDELLDKHISKSTHFSTWQSMLDKATELYISNKLGL